MGVVVLAALLCGCARAPKAQPAGTGARELAQHFCKAMLAQDWDGAYADLAASDQKRMAADHFVRLARQYRANLGFEPSQLRLRSFEEQGPKALAHVVWIGHDGHERRFKDGFALQNDGTGWGVILPARFGTHPGKQP